MAQSQENGFEEESALNSGFLIVALHNIAQICL